MLIKTRTKKINIKASMLSADAGKMAPTAWVTKYSNGGKETVIISIINGRIHRPA